MNNGNRWSRFLSNADAHKLYDAVRYSYCIERTLNRHLVIHWERAGVKSNVQRATTAFLKHAGDWMRHNPIGPLTYVWVLENPPVSEDRFGGGLNVHIVIHVPDEWATEFRRRCDAWVRASGGEVRPKVLRLGQVPKRRSFDSYDNLKKGIIGLLVYVFKGADDTTCREFCISHEPQGTIHGKRCGYSESLGPKRRHFPTTALPRYPRIRVAGVRTRRGLFFDIAFWEVQVKRGE